MKFNRKDFLNANNHIIEIDEWIAIEENDLLHHTSVKSVPDVHVTGTLEFDGMNFVSSDLSMDGTMVVLDSITNEDIDVPFETESQQTYSFCSCRGCRGSGNYRGEKKIQSILTQRFSKRYYMRLNEYHSFTS